MTSTNTGARGPLSGLRVIDAGNLVAGPLTCTLLGDLGADVIKVEHPRNGDPSRFYGPQVDGHGLFWKTLSRNKRCITLDLGHARGREVLLRLVRTTDVLVENFRAGTFDRWGLSWEQLRKVNPGLVLLRTSGFGQDGPYSAMPGFGTLAESMSGFAYLTGEPDGPPQLPQFPLADGVAAMVGTYGVLAALYHRRENAGEGQWIDNSLCEPLMRLMEIAPVEHAATGVTRQRTGTKLKDTAPRGAHETKEPDRWISLSGSNPATARRILLAIERPDLADDPRLSDNQGRIAHAPLIDEAIADWVGRHTQAEALAGFRAADAPVAPIYDSAQLLADPHFKARSVFVDVDDPDLGSMTVQNVMPCFSETPGAIRSTGPGKGQHNREIYLGELGLTEQELADLQDEGVV